jgi:hypothetical protein
VLFLAFLISIPYRDREDHYTGIWFSGLPGRKITWQSVIYAVLVTILPVFVLVRFGWLNNWFPSIPQIVLILINPATITATAYILWSIRIRRKTGSSRMSAIAMFSCTMTGFLIFTVIGIWFRGPNWEFL